MRVEATQFIKDNKGNKLFAIIPMEEYNSFLEYQREIEVMEDFEDIQDAQLRKNEKSYPANQIFAQIKAKRNERS